MSGRIAAAFAAAARRGAPRFIPYLTAGDPDLPGTVAGRRAGARRRRHRRSWACRSPTRSRWSRESARRGGAPALGHDVVAVLELCASLRREEGPPIVLFTYFNPIIVSACGLARARRFGVEGSW